MRFSRQQKLGFFKTCLGFGMGMAGQLFVQLPSIGFMPMLDVCSYAIGPVLLVFLWPRMGRFMHRSILWGLAWSLAAVVANLITFYEFRYALKSVAIVSSCWTIMTVTWWLLRGDARIYLWYLVGSAVGGFISLYHFQPGTIYSVALQTGGRAIDSLVEKVRYPYYAKLFFFGGILPFYIVWRKMPPLVAIAGAIASGLYLLFHGGARSVFGIYAVAGMVGFGACYMRKTAVYFARHTVLLFGAAGLGAAALFGLYAHWAQSGALGEGELKKYEYEEAASDESGDSRMVTRGHWNETFEVILSKPWGEGGTNRRHSVLSNSLNCEGFVGLAFWIHYLLCLLWFAKKRIVYSRVFSVFMMQMIIGQVWCIFGSPFAGRHSFFALMAFIALCRDDPSYGAGTIFDAPLLTSRRYPRVNRF